MGTAERWEGWTGRGALFLAAAVQAGLRDGDQAAEAAADKEFLNDNLTCFSVEMTEDMQS